MGNLQVWASLQLVKNQSLLWSHIFVSFVTSALTVVYLLVMRKCCEFNIRLYFLPKLPSGRRLMVPACKTKRNKNSSHTLYSSLLTTDSFLILI